MAKDLALTVQKRTATGKGPCRRMREQGLVPGIFYNAEGENISVQVAQMPLIKLNQAGGAKHVFQLTIEDNGSTESRPALIWKLVQHPYKRQIQHVDFFGVDMTKEIKIMVPVHVEGDSPGIKLGGRLEIYRDTLEVLCLPGNIPDAIVVDISEMNIGDSVQIEDITFGEGVQALFDSNFAVIGVVEVSESDESLEETEGVEGEEAAEAEEGGESASEE